MFTFDRRTIDSSGAFLVGELERLDKTLHAPLSSVTWGRDIDLREDVTIADESSSFTLSNYAASGNPNPKGKNWIGGNATAIAGIALDINKVSLALHLWGMELGYSLPELAAAQQVGRPIDTQKYEGIKLKFQMDTDEMVYVGDADLGVPGLVNSDAVTPENVTTEWSDASATPEMILDDINRLETVGLCRLPDAPARPPCGDGEARQARHNCGQQVDPSVCPGRMPCTSDQRASA